MPGQTWSRAFSALAILLLLSSVSSPADAQIRFDLPAQPLSQALTTLGSLANINIVFDATTVDGIRAPALKADLGADDALVRLLAGTRLRAVRVDENTIRVVAGTESKRAQNATSIPTGQIPTAVGVHLASAVATSVGEINTPSAVPSAADDSERQFRGLEEVVVTAQKREERLQDVPISISVLNGAALDRSTFQGVSEALNAVPGVAATQTYLGGGTAIEIRGVGAAFPLFVGPSAVAYYLDSVPFGLVKSAVGPDANVYDLSRVEVLRGPQGTLYGASALNGVVRVLTNDADPTEFDLKARGSGAYTDDGSGSYRADVMLNAPIIDNKLAARATVGYQHNGGWIDQPNDKDANYTNVASYRLKLNATPTSGLSFGLSASRSQQNSGAPDLGHTFDQNASLLPQPSSTVYDAYGLKVEYRFSTFEVISAASYLDYRNEGTLGLDVPGFGVPGSQYFSKLNSSIASEELNLTSTLEGSWGWSIGGIYRHGTDDSYRAFTVIPIPPPAFVDTSKSYAVYGELTRYFFDRKLEITAGARHFHDDVTQNGDTAPNTPLLYAATTAEANTPRAIVTWHASPDLMVYGSYAQGFRSGFPQDTPVLQADPAVLAAKPDRLRNYEVGFKGTLPAAHLAFDASVYHMVWSDIQLQVAIPINGLPYPGVVNGARARGDGVDFALMWKPLDNLTVSPYVSWNNLGIVGAVISNGAILYHDGDRPSGSPETTAGISASYAFTVGAIPGRLTFSGNYTSAQSYRTVGTTLLVQSSDPIVITRARMEFDLSNRWTATVYGDNLNNDRGTTAVEFPGVVPDWDQRIRPLTIGVQAEYRMH